MDIKQLDQALQRINDTYYETEDRAQAIAALDELHRSVKGNEAALAHFQTAAANVAGGQYVAHLFWVALAQYQKDPATRGNLMPLFEALAASEFDEELKLEIKPLIVIYLAIEKQFEIDKVKARVFDKAHPAVKEFFEKLIEFVTKNVNSVNAYRQKFALLRNRHPDFELFSQPISRLEEELA